MFGGLGWPEAAVLLVLGLFVFGPERLPGMAQEAGKALRKIRLYLKDMRDDLAAELGPEVGELDLKSLHPKEFVRKHLFTDEEDVAVAVPAKAVLGPGEFAPWDPDTT